MIMLQDLKDLIEISRFYGKDKRAVIAGGGNTSLKTEDRLWVKASGHALASIDETGFAVMDREKLGVISTRSYSSEPFQREREIKNDLMAACLTPERRPSVETSLHDLIQYKYVVHLHPTLVNGVMCGVKAEDHLAGIFGKEAMYIPYTDPGYILFKEIENRLTEYRRQSVNDPNLILLQNHGIFASADTVEEIRGIYDRIFSRLEEYAASMPSTEPREVNGEITAWLPALRMQLSQGGLKTLRLRNSKLIEYFTESSGKFGEISKPFTPDIIVYCKSRYLYVENSGGPDGLMDALGKRVEGFREANGFLPKVILVRGTGMIASGDNAAEADTILDVFEDMMQIAWLSQSFGGPHPMGPEQIQFIDTWEVENYRRKTSAGQAGEGPAWQRNIIVTGAAMGFGAGIARGLFERGANIVIADINEEAGKKTRENFQAPGKKNQAIFIKTDVSDPASLENLVTETVKAFGGLDCFISNAGILRAGGLDEMDEKTFDLVTKINYNAYFYGTKAASRIMKIQHRALTGEPGGGSASRRGKGYFSDIIQINSKSGLSGSKKNFAYAGGKFGGIGLTQSFALELAEWNIKVNSVCPGNFFEGPLWSDPENGLFIQYLKAGKVPGAQSVEDVKKHYESQVPLGRGCRPEDVLKAILYILDQEYETGQAIPVTGGQTMLK